MKNLDFDRLRGAFARDGFLVLPGFYDPEAVVAPIQEGIRTVVELVARQEGLEVPCEDAEAAMTRGYPKLAGHDRALGARVYDAVKQIPAFMRLVSRRENADLFAALRPGSVPGLAAGGYGIRIDNPREERFRTYWHQEFPAQLRSLDGVVFWSPLLPVVPEMGPVEVAKASHREGLVPVVVDEGGAGRTGAYAMRLEDEETRVASYEHVAPCTRPGDLILLDFLTLHQSGVNRAAYPRWSMQFRYFNFADPIGMAIGWEGAFAQQRPLDEILQAAHRHIESPPGGEV